MGLDHDKFCTESKKDHDIVVDEKIHLKSKKNFTNISTENKSIHATCQNCEKEGTTRKRTFSAQAWSVLLIWNEINPKAVEQAICDDCYEELRMTLIERMDEIEEAINKNKKDNPCTFNLKNNIAI